MRYLSALLLAGLVALAFGTSAAQTDRPADDAATTAQVRELQARIEALTARLDAVGGLRAEIAALRAEMTALRAAIADLRGAVAPPAEASVAETPPAETTPPRRPAGPASAPAATAAARSGGDARPAAVPAPPPGKPGGTPRTENEKAVLEAAAPLLAYDTPGPDVVACGDPWFCVADFATNPRYKGQANVFGNIEAADRAWERAGKPADGGIAFLPGVHVVKNLGRENFFRNVRRVRAQDKTRETVADCGRGWPRSDFCLWNIGDAVVTFEGFEVRDAWGRSRRAAVGAISDRDARLVLIDMTLSRSDNGIRTTGGWVAMFRTRLVGNSRTDVAHGAYISNDNRRGRLCPVVVAVDVVSVANEVAHAFKTRCRVVYIKGGLYEASKGFAVDNAQGGRMLIEDAEIVQKAPSRQWVVIAHGLDKLVRDTGFPTKRYMGQQHAVANVWRGQTTLRDVRIVNELSPGFAGIWNDSKYRLPERDGEGNVIRNPDGSFVYKETSEVFTADPVELINVTVDGQPVAADDVVGPSALLP